MNIWGKILEAVNKKVDSMSKLRTSAPLSDMSKNIGRSNPEQRGNRVSVYNAQSWNPETHPQGRGDSYLVQDFDYDNDGTLQVTYRDGFTAEYKNIDPQDAKEFARADSKGRWARKHLWDLPYKEVK